MKLCEESLGFLFADISRLMRQNFQKQFEGDSALTLAQARALVYISRHEGIRQVELAELLDVQPITLARMIDQLEESQLVERRPDPQDRRAYHIYLTPAAAPQLAALKKASDSYWNAALKGVGKEQTAQLSETLKKIRDNLVSR